MKFVFQNLIVNFFVQKTCFKILVFVFSVYFKPYFARLLQPLALLCLSFNVICHFNFAVSYFYLGYNFQRLVPCFTILSSFTTLVLLLFQIFNKTFFVLRTRCPKMQFVILLHVPKLTTGRPLNTYVTLLF